MPEDTYEGFDVGEEMRVKRVTWRGEVVEMVLLSLIIASALAGLFGSGPLSSQTRSSEGLQVEWERFQRLERPTSMRVRYPVSADSAPRVTIDRSILQDWRIESIEPQPEKAESSDDSVSYVFGAAEGAAGGEVVFEITPRKMGSRSFSVESDAGTVEVGAFVYP